MENKEKYITPIIMLFAVALSAIIMLLENYEMLTMLKTLLIVSIVFYFIGDIARYIYTNVKPRIIPQDNLQAMSKLSLDQCFEAAKDGVFEEAHFTYMESDDKSVENTEDTYEQFDFENGSDQNTINEEGYSDEDLSDFNYEGYTEENLE